MSPAQMLDAIDRAIADADARRLKRRALVLHLTAPAVLGVTGRAVEPDEDGGPVVYGYTRKQARRIRDAILAAIRTDIDALGMPR